MILQNWETIGVGVYPVAEELAAYVTVGLSNPILYWDGTIFE